MFIVFEGLDGSGSSTQARLLMEKLESVGRPALLTKEPTGNSPTGRMIREILQRKWEASPEGLQLLFCADRAEHLKNEILPALHNGRIAISDRYFFSTIAYGALAVKDPEWLRALNRLFPVPDLTFLLKLDPQQCIQRISGRGSDFELFEQHEKLEIVWKNYESLIHKYMGVHVIDASRSVEEVAEEVWKVTSDK